MAEVDERVARLEAQVAELTALVGTVTDLHARLEYLEGRCRVVMTTLTAVGALASSASAGIDQRASGTQLTVIASPRC